MGWVGFLCLYVCLEVVDELVLGFEDRVWHTGVWICHGLRGGRLFRTWRVKWNLRCEHHRSSWRKLNHRITEWFGLEGIVGTKDRSCLCVLRFMLLCICSWYSFWGSFLSQHNSIHIPTWSISLWSPFCYVKHGLKYWHPCKGDTSLKAHRVWLLSSKHWRRKHVRKKGFALWETPLPTLSPLWPWVVCFPAPGLCLSFAGHGHTATKPWKYLPEGDVTHLWS